MVGVTKITRCIPRELTDAATDTDHEHSKEHKWETSKDDRRTDEYRAYRSSCISRCEGRSSPDSQTQR